MPFPEDWSGFSTIPRTQTRKHIIRVSGEGAEGKLSERSEGQRFCVLSRCASSTLVSSASWTWFRCTYTVKPPTSAADDFNRRWSSAYFPRLVSARRAGIWREWSLESRLDAGVHRPSLRRNHRRTFAAEPDPRNRRPFRFSFIYVASLLFLGY